ncbi:hypothetical protein Hanom_Chr14g01251441 [Helianthus anomalus]
MLQVYILSWSKQPFWSMRFAQFCNSSSNLKLFVSEFIWFHFCCHFGSKVKSDQIPYIKPSSFVLFHRGNLLIFVLL